MSGHLPGFLLRKVPALSQETRSLVLDSGRGNFSIVRSFLDLSKRFTLPFKGSDIGVVPGKFLPMDCDAIHRGFSHTVPSNFPRKFMDLSSETKP
jgi:hypothetical protein